MVRCALRSKLQSSVRAGTHTFFILPYKILSLPPLMTFQHIKCAPVFKPNQIELFTLLNKIYCRGWMHVIKYSTWLGSFKRELYIVMMFVKRVLINNNSHCNDSLPHLTIHACLLIANSYSFVIFIKSNDHLS